MYKCLNMCPSVQERCAMSVVHLNIYLLEIAPCWYYGEMFHRVVEGFQCHTQAFKYTPQGVFLNNSPQISCKHMLIISSGSQGGPWAGNGSSKCLRNMIALAPNILLTFSKRRWGSCQSSFALHSNSAWSWISDPQGIQMNLMECRWQDFEEINRCSVIMGFNNLKTKHSSTTVYPSANEDNLPGW